MALTIVLLIGIAVVAVAISFEVWGWAKGTRLISKQQKGYRLAAAIVLELVLVMILLGGVLTAGQEELFILSYWSGVMALSFMLVVLALLDVRASLSAYTERRQEMFKDLLDKEREKE